MNHFVNYLLIYVICKLNFIVHIFLLLWDKVLSIVQDSLYFTVYLKLNLYFLNMYFNFSIDNTFLVAIQ